MVAITISVFTRTAKTGSGVINWADLVVAVFSVQPDAVVVLGLEIVGDFLGYRFRRGI